MALQASLSGAPDARTLELLRARYRAYCAQQAAALPGLLPREGVRELYRRARAGVGGPVEDPLALLVAYCRTILPLPPFEVWLEDYLRDRSAYAEALESVGAPGRDAPVTVELRRLEYEGRGWFAGLSLFRESSGWRGFIAFHPEEPASDGPPPDRVPARSLARTGDIFRGDSSDAVRDRFRSFTPDTLQAFLRSALP